MHFLYALINVLLLAGIIWIFGRKQIVSIFRSRRERINAALDEAERALPELEIAPEPSPPEEKRPDVAEAVEQIQTEAREQEYRLETQFGHACEDMRRAMLLDVRDETVRRAQDLAAERMAEEPYRSALLNHEAEMVNDILARITLSPGDMVYLAKHDVLYVTLTSAYPMAEPLVERIRERVEQMLLEVNGKPSFWVKVDETLIGGFQLRIGDTVYDRTVVNSIARLGEILSEREIDGSDAEQLLPGMADTVKHTPMENDEYQVGRVLTVSDGICWLDGVSDIMFGEVVAFACGEQGMVLDIEPDRVGCIIFGRYEHIESLSRVRRLGMMMSVPVGDALLGRVVEPLGNPIDGKGHIWASERRPIEFHAPAIPDRKPV